MDIDSTDDRIAPSAPPAAAPLVGERKRMSTGKIVLLLVGICGVLLVTFVGGFAWLFLSGKAAVEPIAVQFLDALEAEDYAGAYEFISPEWQTVDDVDEFTQLETRFRNIMGPPGGRSLTAFNVGSGTSGSYADIAYDVHFANDDAKVTLTLNKTASEWRVNGHRIDSPPIVQAQTCRKCGTLITSMGVFCSQCGAELPAGGGDAR